MRAPVLCALLALVPSQIFAMDASQLKAEQDLRSKEVRDFHCGKNFITFPVRGFYADGKLEKPKDGFYSLTIRKAAISSLTRSLVEFKESDKTELIRVSYPIRHKIVQCLD